MVTAALGAIQDEEPSHRYGVLDGHITDYHLYKCPRTNLTFRGPRPASMAQGRYFTCLGAAQTFGRFCDHPYPTLLEQRLGLAALNLSHPGAGASFFLRHQSLLEDINRSRFVIVQIMSARSEGNSEYESRGSERLLRKRDGAIVRGDDAFANLLGEEALIQLPRGGTRYFFLPIVTDRIRRIVRETRQNCIDSHLALLDRITVPKILFWMSARTPDYRDRYYTVHHLLNGYPQLVNRQMVTAIRSGADGYVESVSNRGLPQQLYDRETGAPTTMPLSADRPHGAQKKTLNTYYPSPDMHRDAADRLEPLCRQIVSASGR